MCRRLALATVALSAALLAGCGSATGGAPLLLEPPKVTAAPAILRRVVDYDEYTGRLQAEQTVEVRARVTGYLNEVRFKDGDLVNEGELLFVIDPSTYRALYEQAKAKIDLWKAKLEFAEATRARNAKLVAGGSVTKEDYESSLATRDEAAASMVSAQAETVSRKLDLDFCEVKSPIAGKIDRTFVTKGNLVQSGPGEPTLLTRIVSVDPIYVYFDVDELALLRYTESRLAEEGALNRVPLRDKKIPVQVALADGSVYSEPGIVDFGSNQVDPTTGTLTVRAVVRNENASLTPGLFVRVKATAGKPYEAVLVPEQAVGTDQSEKFVYVVDASSKAQRRKVVLGSKQGSLRVVKEGLKEGEKVIINGLLLVRPDSPVTAEAGKMPEPPPLDPRWLRPDVTGPGDGAAAPARTSPEPHFRKPIER